MKAVYPVTGFCDITCTTAEEEVDLSTLAGRWVRLQCEIQDLYIMFTATGGTMDVNAAALGGIVPIVLRVGDTMDFLVQSNRAFLQYRTITGTGGFLRVVQMNDPA